MLLLGCLPGCLAFRDEFEGATADKRYGMQAHFASARYRKYYRDVEHRSDFQRGFRAGYYDVASGGDGGPPVIPPQRYWHYKYRNAEGHCKTVAWFDGFEHGALAAHQDGRSGFNHIVTRNEVRGGWHADGWLEQEVHGQPLPEPVQEQQPIVPGHPTLGLNVLEVPPFENSQILNQD
jgi:hypothetical protein